MWPWAEGTGTGSMSTLLVFCTVYCYRQANDGWGNSRVRISMDFSCYCDLYTFSNTGTFISSYVFMSTSEIINSRVHLEPNFLSNYDCIDGVTVLTSIWKISAASPFSPFIRTLWYTQKALPDSPLSLTWTLEVRISAPAFTQFWIQGQISFSCNFHLLWWEVQDPASLFSEYQEILVKSLEFTNIVRGIGDFPKSHSTVLTALFK